MKFTDKFESLPGVYIFKCLINGKHYVGESVNIKTRMRKHQTEKRQLISKAIKKHGVENFEIYVEYFPDFKKSDLIDLEEQLIIKFDCLSPKGYNICKKGLDQVGFTHSDETKQKISKANSGKRRTEEQKLKFSRVQLGKKASDLTREKISLGHKGKKLSLETKLKISNSQKGIKKSEEMKAKLSESAKNLAPIPCPHCGFSCSPANASRWHFNNCKLQK